MASNLPTYSRFTIKSVPDAYSGGFSIPDYERDMKAIVNQAVKSALSEGGYFKTDSRIVDKKTGETKIDVYVHSEDANVVADSISSELKKLTYKDNFGMNRGAKYDYTRDTPSDKEQRSLAREEAKGDTEITRFNKSTFLKIVGLLTTIADITRRILSSVLTFSAQTVQDMVKAHNLGLSYEAVRAYRHTEAQHSLKEGTITDAIAGEQQKYGNITSLDEKSLEYIALIMGNKVADMATMGLGASNPEAIVGAIIDRANELANSGYNSVGQYVGEQQARRELYSYLLKYSPQIADIFATMQEEQHNINSLFRNQADTFAEWKNLLPTKRGGSTPMDYNVSATLGQEWNIVKDILSQIKEGLMVSLSPAVLDLLRKIADTRVGMSEKEKQERNKENRSENLKAIASVNAQMKSYEDNWGSLTESEKFYYGALRTYKEELEKANKGNWLTGNISYAVRTPEELRVLANQQAKHDYRTMGAYRSDVAPTPDEILGVIEGHSKFDINKEKAKFEKIRSKVNADEFQRRKEEAIDERISEATADYVTASETKGNAEYLSTTARANKFDYAKHKLVGAVLRLQDDKDFYDKNGKLKSYDELVKIMFAKKYLLSSGNMGEWTMNRTKVGIDTAGIASQIAEENPIDDESFLYWLYALNSSYFNEKIMGVRADELIAQSVKKNRLASLYALATTEGGATDWRNKIPSTYTGGGTLIGYNDVQNGEVVHKIVLSVGGKEYELGSFLGMTGYENTIGELNVNTTNGKNEYSVSLGTAGSVQGKLNE